MKKFRKLTVLFASLLCMTSLAGCATPPTQQEIDATIATVIPSPESIQREGINIESIVFENVPAEIPVGSFNDFDMKLKITYSDGFVEHYPLKIENFPNKVQEELLLVGNHSITIAFRGSIVTYNFNIVAGVTAFYVNYHNYDGKVIKSYRVLPTNPHVPENAPAGPERKSDALFSYSFQEWDDIVTPAMVITKHYNIYPVYEKIQKRYDVSKQLVPTLKDGNIRLMHANYSGTYYGLYSAYLYLGRIDRVPILKTNYEDKDLCTHIDGSMYFDMTDTSKTEEEHVTAYTTGLAQEILGKGFDIDTSNASNYFSTINSDPVNPKINVASGFDIDGTLQGNTSILFEEDVSYSEVYKGNLAKYVKDHNQGNGVEYEVEAATDMIATNQYFRATVETSIDVVARADFYYYDQNTPKIEFLDFEYYFMLDLDSTYPVAEYCNDTNFNSTGTKIEYSMGDISNILTYVVEAE